MVNTKDQRVQCIVWCVCCVCWHCQRQRMKACNAFNAVYVDTVNTKHIHTFLPITFLIFNWFSIWKSFGKLRLRAFQPYHQILYMLILLIQDKRISNVFNAIYVNTVNTKHESAWCIQCYLCWHCQYKALNSVICSILCMLIQLTQSHYSIDSNTKSLNYMKIQLNGLNYNRF